MDCNTARLFLHFSRPQADELEAATAWRPRRHLGHCPECAAKAGVSAASNNTLAGPCARSRSLTACAAAARWLPSASAWYRRWAWHAGRAAVAAALLLCLCWGWSAGRMKLRPPSTRANHPRLLPEPPQQ